MSAITEARDPVAVLGGGAPDGGQGEYIEGLKKDCGFIISKIDSIVNALTGFSLLEALFKPIAGDFDTVSSMQKGWGNVGVSLGAVGDNYRSLSGQLPGVWEGQASRAAQHRLTDIADMHDGQQEATQHIQDQLGHVIEVAQATAEVVAAEGALAGLLRALLAALVALLLELLVLPLDRGGHRTQGRDRVGGLAVGVLEGGAQPRVLGHGRSPVVVRRVGQSGSGGVSRSRARWSRPCGCRRTCWPRRCRTGARCRPPRGRR